MKIKQLIEKLRKLNQESEVILSSDEEGNNYSVLDEIYVEKGLRFSEDYDNGLPTLFSREDVISGDISKEEYLKMKNCIVLYPE